MSFLFIQGVDLELCRYTTFGFVIGNRVGIQIIGFGMLPVLYGIRDGVLYHGARIVSEAAAEWIVDETEVGLRHDLYTSLIFLSFQD